jgi:hypothetical protein
MKEMERNDYLLFTFLGVVLFFSGIVFAVKISPAFIGFCIISVLFDGYLDTFKVKKKKVMK